MSLGAIGFGLADTYAVAFAARLAVGLGGGLLYVPILRYAADWFRADEFATVTGLTVATSALGGMLATAPLAVAIEAAGWRLSVIGLGVIGVLFALLAYRIVDDTPARAGFPDVESDPSDESRQSISDLFSTLRLVLFDRLTWTIGMIVFCGLGIHYTVVGLWAIPYLVDVYHLPVQRASTLLLVANVGLLLGSVGIGRLLDHIGRRVDLVLVTGILFASAFALLGVLGTPPLTVVGVVLFTEMLLVGGFSLSYTIVKERHAGDVSGTAIGLVNALGYAGSTVFPILFGWVLDAYWTGELVAGSRTYTVLGYRVAFFVAALVGVIAVGLTLTVRHTIRRG
ncbi:MFS transporter (plasmid) [Natronosalvus rutilus]|uniref:MFS transporter n=2 Tax=Natronosalvus rutilus TaxID=2953753 RepID=A0A9E7NC02_9EURY|nr:MFS transporter [Natronosalvus rutilus]